MTDLHTHILPGMDDGAQTVEESLEMLRLSMQQGVDTVALTPHFNSKKESISDFLARREAAFQRLRDAAEGREIPELLLGAEVAWTPDMTEWEDLGALCYQNTNILLVELPVSPWSDTIFQQLYSLEGRRGILPMIAHLDRYFYCQKEDHIERLLERGYPIQISAEALTTFFYRKKALDLLLNYDGLLISDCHNVSGRRPNLAAAMRVIDKKFGHRAVNNIAAITDEIFSE